MSNFDITKHIDPDECTASWKLRKWFLLEHHDKFPENRLVCLAQCFVNVELYGNRYPAGVMTQLNALTVDFQHERDTAQEENDQNQSEVISYNDNKRAHFELNEENASRKQEFKMKRLNDKQDVKSGIKRIKSLSMTFVKSTTTSDEIVTTDQNVAMTIVEPVHIPVHKDLNTNINSKHEESFQQIKKTASNDMAQVHNDDQQASTSKKKRKKKKTKPVAKLDYDCFVNLKKQLLVEIRVRSQNENCIMLLNESAQKLHLCIVNEIEGVVKMNMFQCKVYIQSVLTGVGRGPKKQLAKKIAYKASIKEILKKYHSVLTDEKGSHRLIGSDQKQECDGGSFGENEQGEESKIDGASKIFDRIILMSYSMQQDSPAVTKLTQSAQFSNMPCELAYGFNNEGVTCKILLDDEPMVECSAETRKDARDKAAENMMDILKKSCWTIEVNKVADTAQTQLSRDELLGNIERACSGVIPESNVGHKMLQKMGWAGGGVGKHGTGRAEPVQLTSIIKREGLGLMSKASLAQVGRKKIARYLEDYAKSASAEDLVLSQEFNNEERKFMHDQCRKLGIKSHSVGKGKDRYLIVSRKRSAAELFRHILSKGGETPKYKLIPPM